MALNRMFLRADLKGRLRIVAVCSVAWFFVISTVIAAPIPPKKPKPKPTAQRPQLVLDAIELFEGGKFQEAFVKLEKAKKDHAQLPPARVMMANLYFSDNPPQIQLGKILLEQEVAAESKDPKDKDKIVDPEAHLILGDIAVRERRISDAELQYNKGGVWAFKYNEDPERQTNLRVQYWSGIAAVAEARQKWDDAQAALEKVLALKPEHVVAHQRLATALFVQKKPDEAHQHLVEAVKNDKIEAEKNQREKTLPPAAMLMASLYLQNRGTDKSTEWFNKTEEWLNKAVAEAPKDPRPQVAMARWMWDNSEIEKAEKYALQAEQLDEESQEVKVFLGLIARFRKDYAKAEKYLEDVVKQSPSNFQASNQLALVLIEQKDKAKQSRALEQAKMNIQADQQNSEAAATLGWILYRLDDLDNAERSFRIAAASRNISRDTAYYMARFRYKLGNRAEAKTLLKQAFDATGPFANLAEAEQWDKQIKGDTATKSDKSESALEEDTSSK